MPRSECLVDSTSRVKGPALKDHVFRLGELFCGPGGFGHAADMASRVINGSRYRIEHAWANDIDQDSCNTYLKNFSSSNNSPLALCKDIRKVNFAKDLPKAIDALTFGFPCNDFSIVGEQKGLTGHYGPLYTYGIAAVKHFKPKWFIAENVGGLRNANDGGALGKILADLKALKPSYRITPHYYKFEEYGVPQTRHRVIIVGIRNDLNKTFRVPRPTHKGNFVSVRDALKNIPLDALNQEFTRQSPVVSKRLALIKPGQNVWTADLPKHLQLNVKGARLSQIYKRLDPNKPAYTITGSGGGGTHVYHYAEPRALTNRERARIQTFEDGYIFTGSKESVRKQIGMAIPPLGVKQIIEAIFLTLAGVAYPAIDSDWDEILSARPR